MSHRGPRSEKSSPAGVGVKTRGPRPVCNLSAFAREVLNETAPPPPTRARCEARAAPGDGIGLRIDGAGWGGPVYLADTPAG